MELDPRWAPRWRDLSDAEREREYTPSSCTDGQVQPFIDEYVEFSASARQAVADLGAELHLIDYGPSATQSVDVAVPAGVTAMPIVVYLSLIHI